MRKKKKKKTLGQWGGASSGAEVLLHSCIGFLWLPIEAPSGCQPTTEKRELQREENSHKAPEVEVQPEKLQPGWDCSVTWQSVAHSAPQASQH